MSRDPSLRESHFPAIERRYGEPMSYWFTKMKRVANHPYPEQMRYLQETFGFSRAHANALIMFTRGSESSRRFSTLTQYLATLDSAQAKTIRKIFRVIRSKYPKLELVIAWNQPMLKNGDEYIFGASAAKNHLLIAPWRAEVLKEMQSQLADYQVNKKTIRIPNDWEVDEKLLVKMIQISLRKKGS